MAIGSMAALFDSTEILFEFAAQWTPTYTQCLACAFFLGLAKIRMSHVNSNQKSLKKEFILYCSKKMHKLDTF